MDAFLVYNQIKMAEEDQEKIAFITSQGLYRALLLQGNAFRVEKHKSNLSKVSKQNVQQTDQEEHGNVHG